MAKLSQAAQNRSAEQAGAAGAIVGRLKTAIAALGKAIGDQFVAQLHYLVVHGEHKTAKALRAAFGPWYSTCYKINEAVATIYWNKASGTKLSVAVQKARANVTNCLVFTRSVLYLFSHNRKDCARLTDPSLCKPANSEGVPSEVPESFANRQARIDRLNLEHISAQGITDSSGRNLDKVLESIAAGKKQRKLDRASLGEINKIAYGSEFECDFGEFTVDVPVPTSLPKPLTNWINKVSAM